MRLADVKADGRTAYAVKLPKIAYGRRDGSIVVRAIIEDKGVPHSHVQGSAEGRPGGFWDKGGANFSVPCSAVISTWADYSFARAWEEAHQIDTRVDFDREYKAKREAIQTDVEGWCHLFAGLPVEQPMRPGHDLEDTIHDYFVDSASGTITLRLADVRAIAKRISDLQQEVLNAGGSWAAGDGLVRDGQREVVTLNPAASSTLARLEAALEADESSTDELLDPEGSGYKPEPPWDEGE